MNLFSETTQEYIAPPNEIKTLDFSKFSNLQFKHLPSLFPPDLRLAVAHKTCPWCFCKLYEMRGRPFFYCKSKKCEIYMQTKKKFIIGKDKVIK